MFKQLYVQVIIGILLGIVLGVVEPSWAIGMKPLGDAFIALLKMMLAPIIFCSIVTGLMHVADMRQLGRLALKSLLYFEVLTTVAMALGMIAANVMQPGVGLHAASLATDDNLAKITTTAGSFTAVKFFLSIIPTTLVDAFARGEILQVLLVSVLVGAALSVGASKDSILLKWIVEAQHVLFRMLGFIMKLAPIGAFGAMAAAVGAFGVGTLGYLAKLVVLYWATSAVFVVVILGAVCASVGLSIFGILRLIRDELLIVFGTASSEVVLPRLMQKLEAAGCDSAIVGFVVPSGYSFNLDGTSIYMALAIGFIAQATDTPFSIWQQLGVLAILFLTSKGGTTVAGGAFIKLAATLQTVHTLPLNGLSLLFGIDRLMATCTALTNVVGNTVATFVIAKWENEFDPAKWANCLERISSDAQLEPTNVAVAVAHEAERERA